MQEWYRRKYEGHLFNNRNDLYNLISYIQSATKSGVSDDEMANKLRRIGWSSEQVNYVVRKYSGRKTGMVEILPLGKVLDKFNKKHVPVPKNNPGMRNNRFNGTRKI